MVIAALFACAAVPEAVLRSESERIAAINRVRPSVVAVFDGGGQGGGSGVLIDADGYALTNFHVVQGSGPTMRCGLPDGVLYDAVLVGLDKVGDVALIKLLPKEKGKPFPFAPMGDSEAVRVGDWSLAMGNPFLLATDFTPTVTFGLVSGTHRYQYPSGTILEYTDCIQIDTSINPGNSGGPLFNLKGELIGINGRGSFEKRGRVNSGVGYAISINQIKNFMEHLRAGIDTDHATLGATMRRADDGDLVRTAVAQVLEESDAARRGIQGDDELVAFAGRPITSVNQFKNVLGIFPKGWRVPLTYRRENVKKETLVRLMGLLPKGGAGDEGGEKKPRRPGIPVPGRPKEEGSPEALKLHKAKDGYANYYFNERAQERVIDKLKEKSDLSGFEGWSFTGELDRKGQKSSITFDLSEEAGEGGKQPLLKLSVGGLDYAVRPLKSGADPRDLRDPPGSGGLPTALYHYHRLLANGPKGFEGGFSHGGGGPCYPPGVGPAGERRVDVEFLLTEHAAVNATWFARKSDGLLAGGEVSLAKDEDPCELYFNDYKSVAGGRLLPHRIDVVFGDASFGTIIVREHKLR